MALALTLGILVFTHGRPSRADCAPQFTKWVWFPVSGGVVPLNFRPRLVIERTEAWIHAKTPTFAGAKVLCSTGSGLVERELRVERTIRERYIAFEMTPLANLPEDSSCAVVHPEVRRGETVTWFRTERVLDETPPSAQLERVVITSRFDLDTVGSVYGQSPPGYGRTELQFTNVRDDTSMGQLFVELWYGERGAEIDYSKPPDFVSVDGHLGGDSGCDSVGNFLFPSSYVRHRLGMKLVDLAGRRSSPIEAWIQARTSFQLNEMKLPNEVLGEIVPIRASAVPAPPVAPMPVERSGWVVPLLLATTAVLLAFAGLQLWRRRSSTGA
jgi:hypothetical protein